jgi:hypothetical protein
LNTFQVSGGSILISLIIEELQMGQVGSFSKVRFSLIQQEQSSLLQVQMAVSSSTTGS